MKIYAKQVPPEYQESPLFMGDCFPENIAVFGNRDYNRHAFPLFDALPGILENLSCAWDNMRNGFYDNAIWAKELEDIAPPQGRCAYTRDERKNAWPDLLYRFYSCHSSEENALYCKALELITGRAWDCHTLRGCCQDDWQYMIYPVDDWGSDDLTRFECEYFNTGTEWIVDPDGDSVSVYVTAWDNDKIRQELADAYGCEPGDIILQTFTGWSRTANYREVLPC